MIVNTSYYCKKYEVLYLGGKYYMAASCRKNAWNTYIADLRLMKNKSRMVKAINKFKIWISTND